MQQLTKILHTHHRDIHIQSMLKGKNVVTKKIDCAFFV